VYQIANLLALFLNIITFSIFFRALASWFPIDRDGPVLRALDAITEPVLEPLRRVVPTIGMIDIHGGDDPAAGDRRPRPRRGCASLSTAANLMTLLALSASTSTCFCQDADRAARAVDGGTPRRCEQPHGAPLARRRRAVLRRAPAPGWRPRRSSPGRSARRAPLAG
jgi:hypothetical protein